VLYYVPNRPSERAFKTPIGPPIETISVNGKRLAGILTCASSVPAAFPERLLQWLVGRTSTLTVAGQWRIFTALPNCQTVRYAIPAGTAFTSTSTLQSQSPLRLGLLFVVLLRLRAVHRFFETADTFSQSFSKFRKLFGTEDQKGDEKNNQQMCRLKQVIKHIAPPEI
jgi:hypothetical protein